MVAATLLTSAVPAIAASFVVCADTTKDARFSTETATPSGGTTASPLFFAATAPVYPGGTNITASTAACDPASVGATQIGALFSFGGFVNGLPQSTPPNVNDLFFVIWHCRITGVVAFDTTGPVRAKPAYLQTIIGSQNENVVPTHGIAFVVVC
jgi:hypothetical protein